MGIDLSKGEYIDDNGELKYDPTLEADQHYQDIVDEYEQEITEKIINKLSKIIYSIHGMSEPFIESNKWGQDFINAEELINHIKRKLEQNDE